MDRNHTVQPAGILVDVANYHNRHTIIQHYKDALLCLITNDTLRESYGASGRQRVLNIFNATTNMHVISDYFIPHLHKQHVLPQIHDLRNANNNNIRYNPSAVYGIQQTIYDESDQSDISYIVHSMLPPRRTGKSGVLQSICSENKASDTQWLNSITELNIDCNGNLLSDSFMRSIQRQCFQWCVFDVNTVDMHGWMFVNGRCWQWFDGNAIPPHYCVQKYTHMKPK